MLYRCMMVFAVGLLITVGSFAADTRFMGMGNLAFLFQDDYHRLDLYDFAGISSGFFRNDTVSFTGLRGSVLREEWERDSVVYWAIGQALPEKLQEYAPIEALGYYEFIPTFQTIPWELIYISRRTEAGYDYFGGELSRQSWGFWGGYSRLSRTFDEETESIGTPSLNLIYARPFSDRFDFGVAFDAFYGSYSSPGGTYGASLVPLGGGAGVSYSDAKFDVGINTEYHYLNFSFEYPSGTEESFSGHALSPVLGWVLRMAGLTWANALNYRWVNLVGSYDGNDLGDLELIGYSAKTQLLYAMKTFRAALFGSAYQQSPVYTDATGNVDFETEYMNYLFGGGVGVTHGPALIGVEGFVQRIRTDDRVMEETIRSSDWGVKVGLEIKPIRQIALRGGFNYLTVDPNVDMEDDISKTNTITCGFGFNATGRTRFDIGYNYKQTETDLYPDERIKDHVVFIYLKHLITESGE
ncbi:MAG: hypothetical protein JSV53_08675 [candidate division WOR-3 bacterium]|nr:MAG: hypothetical protein JSV53_08675 [candidate division WOR-3 bacterium]